MRNLLTGIILVLFFYSGSVKAQPIVTEIDGHFTKIDFGHQVMMVILISATADESFRPLTGGITLTALKRRQYVEMVKNEILRLPKSFVTRYVIDNVFSLGLTKGCYRIPRR